MDRNKKKIVSNKMIFQKNLSLKNNILKKDFLVENLAETMKNLKKVNKKNWFMKEIQQMGKKMVLAN